MRRLVLLALSAVSIRGQESIIADRPGFADGPAVVGNGVAQLEIGVTHEDGLTLPTLVRFGLSDRFELRVESDVVESAPVGAGFKLRLRDGTFPLALLVSGTTDREAQARLLSEIELGHGFALTPNVGVAFTEGGDATAVVAATLEREIGHALPFVDLETTIGGGDTSTVADAGIAWIVRRDTQLDISAGVPLNGDSDWFLSAGYSRRF